MWTTVVPPVFWEICWAVARKVAALCTKFGIQDKAAKLTFPTPTPGPWSGTVCHTDQGEVVGLVSDEKWLKTRGLIQELDALMQETVVKEKQWRETSSCVIAAGGIRGQTHYSWSPGGREAYRSWHKDPTRKVLRKRLLEIRGFLNYVVRTYPWMNPYLKGLHLTIDGWRRGRNSGGWRFKEPATFPGKRAHNEELGGDGERSGPSGEEVDPARVTPKAVW